MSPTAAVSVKPPRITLARERASTVLDDIKPLLIAHYREIAHFQDIPLDPDYTRYLEMDLKGLLRIYTVRDHELLVGYALYFVMPALHYRGSLQAFQDILFIHPDYRKGRSGMALLKFSHEALKSDGVQVVRQHVKAAHNFGPLLERLGYELEDLIYTKRLD